MKKIYIALLASILLSSCVKEILDTVDKVEKTSAVTWNPTLAVPLVYSTLGMKDILKTTEDLDLVRVESDGGVTIVYSDVIFSKTAEEAISLPDQSFSETIILTPTQASILDNTGSLTINVTRNINYNYSSNEIDMITFKSGSFETGISTTLMHDVSMQVVIDEAVKNSSSFDVTTTANYGGSLPNAGNSVEDLNGYDVDFTQTSQGYSGLKVDFNITINKQSGNVVGPAESITLNFDMLNQGFQYFEGYVTALDLTNAAQSVDVSIFDGATNGSFTLADPRVKLIFANSMGVPIEANITQFDGTNTDGNTIALTGYPSPLPIPTLDFSEIGQVKYDSFTLNTSNSNLDVYINNKPKTNDFDATVVTNPAGPSVRNWFLDTSLIEVKAEIVLPLHGTASDYEFEQIQDFEFEVDGAEQIDEILIRLFTINGFPVDIETQAYFEDSITNTVLDSLITGDDLIMPAAGVDGSGRVNQSFPKTVDVLYSGSRIDNLKQANRLRIKARINTTNQGGTQPDVKIYDDYELQLELGVQAALQINQEL